MMRPVVPSPLDAPVTVQYAAELVAALLSGAKTVRVMGTVSVAGPLVLTCGQSLEAADDGASLSFEGDGVILAGNNRIEGLCIRCPPDRRAIAIAPDASGSFLLRDLQCDGRVQLIFGGGYGPSQLTLSGIVVSDADARATLPRPFGNGVEVQQGALTIWNRAEDGSVLYLDARDIQIGQANRPVRGTGLFIAGSAGMEGGKVILEHCSTGSVYSDSTLTAETTATVAGGIFLLNDVEGAEVLTEGEVITRGANAVPVDNWGRIGTWRIIGNARSYGASAVGFVNAGDLGHLDIRGGIETFGDGARGCCIYGPVGVITADIIRTHGDAATGLQVVSRLDAVYLREGIFTNGRAGVGLVKGQMVPTPAHGIDIEAGGHLGSVDCAVIQVESADAQPICNEGRLDRLIRPAL